MLILRMGSKTHTDELVPKEEAARILNVSVRTVERMVKQGVLDITSDGLLHLSDLSAVAEVTAEEGSFKIATVMNTALKALVISRRNERHLTQIMGVLGAELPTLSLEQEDVLALYEAAVEADRMGIEEPEVPQVMEWAKTFLAITEEYLDLVGTYTSSREPWKIFLSLAQELVVNAPVGRFRAEPLLERAYGVLTMARRHLRNVAYFYVRAQKGKRFADRLLPDAELDDHERVLSLLFSV